jgi:hypothetical protein
MTGPEAAAYNALKAAVRDAMPKAPQNYAQAFVDGSGSGEFEVWEGIKPDGMARMTFTATYTLDRDFQQQRQQAAFMDRAKGTPEQQAKLAALDAKEAELSNARSNTRDRAEKDRIRAQMKAVQAEADQIRDQIMAEYQAWMMSGGMNAVIEGVDKELPPREFSVRAFVNRDVYLSDKAVPYKFPDSPLAFEQREECQDYGTCCITVLLGAFDKEQRSESTRYIPRNANLGVPTKARSMVLLVAGPKDKPQSVRDFLGKVDLEGLKAVLP